MCWKLTTFRNIKFDAIIGQTILKPLSAIINLNKEYIEINIVKTKFIESCPFHSNEIQTFNIAQPYEEVLGSVKKEEKSLLVKMIKQNSDLFFEEGHSLTHTHEIQHEIITTTGKAIYFKIYRYHEEINDGYDEAGSH